MDTESPNDEFLDLMKASFDEDDFIAPTDADILHGFLAFAQAIECLSAKSVLDQMAERHPWFDEFWHNTTMSSLPGEDEDETLDMLTDFNKDCFKTLNEWCRDRSMGRIRLWIFFSCHAGFGTVTLNPKGESVDPAEID